MFYYYKIGDDDRTHCIHQTTAFAMTLSGLTEPNYHHRRTIIELFKTANKFIRAFMQISLRLASLLSFGVFIHKSSLSGFQYKYRMRIAIIDFQLTLLVSPISTKLVNRHTLQLMSSVW